MNQKAIDLAAELRYQCAAGAHTYGNCSMDNCLRTARGSTHCPACVEVKLAKIIGAKEAQHLHNLYYKLGGIQSDIDKVIGEF